MSGALALCPADLRQFDGEACVQDVRLGEALGMAQPLDIRRVIRKNEQELALHGSIRAARELIEHGKGGRREVTVYHLSEPQALLICMFSRAPNAAAARAQIISVYMAYRRCQLIDADPITRLERRIEQLERVIAFERHVGAPDFIRSVRFAPPIMKLLRDDGSVRTQRNPRHYEIEGARAMVMELHRQMTIKSAVKLINETIGEGTISKSALGREWKKLDLVRAVH